MIDHNACMECSQSLPWYRAGTISTAQHEMIEQHLTSCIQCRRELAVWSKVADIVRAECREQNTPGATPWERLHARIVAEASSAPIVPSSWSGSATGTLTTWLEEVVDLLWIQVRLIGGMPWFFQGVVLALALLLVFLPLSWLERANTIMFASVLLAAIGMTQLYGQGVDVAHELTWSLRTSPRIILLIRLGIIMASQTVVLLSVEGTFALAHTALPSGWFIASWLAPLFCFMAISLLITIVIHPLVAFFTSITLWVLRVASYLPAMRSLPFIGHYEHLWHQALPLLLVSACALGLAFLVLERRERRVW